MINIIKTIFLLGIITFISPLIFFLLIAIFGKFFSITINKESWITKQENRWFKRIQSK